MLCDGTTRTSWTSWTTGKEQEEVLKSPSQTTKQDEEQNTTPRTYIQRFFFVLGSQWHPRDEGTQRR